MIEIGVCFVYRAEKTLLKADGNVWNEEFILTGEVCLDSLHSDVREKRDKVDYFNHLGDDILVFEVFYELENGTDFRSLN